MVDIITFDDLRNKSPIKSGKAFGDVSFVNENNRGVEEMPLLEISIVPVGTNSASFSSYVTNAVRKIEDKGLKYEVTPISTVIEGDIEQLWDIAEKMHQEALSIDTDRVVTHITIDHRTDKQMDMDEQINTVQKELEPKIKDEKGFISKEA